MLQAAGPGEQHWMLNKPSSVLFYLVPLLKKKNASKEFFLMAKKILSEGSRFSFYTHCQWSLLSQLIFQVFN